MLLFHGDRDRNVGIGQSRRMDDRLRDAGRQSELVVFPGLEHDLADSAARADMLRRSDAFLRRALAIAMKKGRPSCEGRPSFSLAVAAGQRE